MSQRQNPSRRRVPEQYGSHTGVDRRIRLEEEVLQLLPVLEPLPELGRLAAELVVGELLELGLEREDVLRLLGDALQPAAFAYA